MSSTAAHSAALTGAAIYAIGFLAKLALQDLPSGAEYGGAITGVAAVLIVQSGVKAVKLSGDLDRMLKLDREVMHEQHKENVEKLKQTLQHCGEAFRQAYRAQGSPSTRLDGSACPIVVSHRAVHALPRSAAVLCLCGHGCPAKATVPSQQRGWSTRITV